MSHVKCLAHTAFKVSDLEKARHFYGEILGLKERFQLSFADMAAGMGLSDEMVNNLPEGSMEREQAAALWNAIKADPDRTFITYFEVAPQQFIEIFAPAGGEEAVIFGLEDMDHIGYLHISLEVDDIHAFYEEIRKTDARILTAPNLGSDGTWQCWIADPDGNAIEVMEYTENSLQLK